MAFSSYIHWQTVKIWYDTWVIEHFGEEKEEYSFVGRKESRRVVWGGGTRGTKITLEPPAEPK